MHAVETICSDGDADEEQCLPHAAADALNSINFHGLRPSVIYNFMALASYCS